VTTNCDLRPQPSALVRTERSQIPINPKTGRGAKVLPDWVHPKWAKKFLPTLTHALYVSKDPFEDFRSSSPTFTATFEMIFRIVYPNTKYDITQDDVLVEEVRHCMPHIN